MYVISISNCIHLLKMTSWFGNIPNLFQFGVSQNNNDNKIFNSITDEIKKNVLPFQIQKRKLEDEDNNEQAKKFKKNKPGVVSIVEENGKIIKTLFYNAEYEKKMTFDNFENNTFYRIETMIGFTRFPKKSKQVIISLEYLQKNIVPFHNLFQQHLEYITFPKGFYIPNDKTYFSYDPKCIIVPPTLDTSSLPWNIPICSTFDQNQALLMYNFLSQYSSNQLQLGDLEKFVRDKTQDQTKSLEYILYKNGGEALWKDDDAITKEHFDFFFPGMANDDENFAKWITFKSKWFNFKKQVNASFSYYGVPFNVNMFLKKKQNIHYSEFVLSFVDYGANENVHDQKNQIIKLTYKRGVLSIDSFFYKTDGALLKTYKNDFLQNLKTTSKNTRGAYSRRGFLYIRFIANLIRSTGRNLLKIELEDAWKPGGTKQRPETEAQWKEFLDGRNWQGEHIGNGEMGTAKNCEYYGFYAAVMEPTGEFLKMDEKGDEGDHYFTYFEPWVSGTASRF